MTVSLKKTNGFIFTGQGGGLQPGLFRFLLTFRRFCWLTRNGRYEFGMRHRIVSVNSRRQSWDIPALHRVHQVTFRRAADRVALRRCHSAILRKGRR